MPQKKRGLGRGLSDLGLDELLGDISSPALAADSLTQTVNASSARDGNLRQMPVDKMKPGRYQPRKNFSDEALAELADSIRSQGVIQPIVVRNMNDGYEIIAGERRWRAAQKAGLQEVPVIVRDISDKAAIAIALIENIQRRSLNAIEESVALQRLISEFAMTHLEVAEAVGKSRAVVTNLLRLQKLNADVKTLVEAGQLEMGHARALLALEGTLQSDIARMVVEKGLSVRETEQKVRVLQGDHPVKAAPKPEDPDVMRLQNTISEKLGAKVAILQTGKGKGKLVVHYNSLDELDGILDHIQ